MHSSCKTTDNRKFKKYVNWSVKCYIMLRSMSKKTIVLTYPHNFKDVLKVTEPLVHDSCDSNKLPIVKSKIYVSCCQASIT